MKRKRVESQIEEEKVNPKKKVQKTDGVQVDIFQIEKKKYSSNETIKNLPFFKNAKVDVVENEKPFGIRCMYFISMSFRIILKPELRSGIRCPARKLANFFSIYLPGRLTRDR